ncbi:PAS domain-containing sensor histidine kinase [uncultured Parabacteroides sp.]|uniref:sensor histidine kinase n=1 Tax=uncultured Parabacteroides sp. TaxID=512312 RepID=UPI0026398DBB|nr:PAS domain-containing sensor histidine kinase [uncultured Parabacteroides sp.]
MAISAYKTNKYRVFFLLIFVFHAMLANGSIFSRHKQEAHTTGTGEYTERPSFLEVYPFEIAGISFTTFLLVLYIMKERRHKKELRKIRTELAIALDAGYMSVWRYNVKKDRFRSLHRATIPEKGMTKKEMKDRIHPKDRKKYDDFFDKLISAQQERVSGIFRLNFKEEENWYDVHAIGLQDETGKIGHIIGTEHNISEEMKQKQDFEKNQQMLDFIFNAVKIMPWEYDAAKQVFNVSDNFAQQYYASRSSIRIDELLHFIHPSDRDLLIDGIDDMVYGNSQLMIIQIRTRSELRNEYKWFEMQGVVYRKNEEGQVTHIIGLKHDITEQKHNEELIRLREKAEESNRLKSAFLANMSHEIRTPLNAIVGFSSLMAETENKEERAEFSRIIQGNNDLLLHLINDILDMSKIESGQMDFKYSDVNLSDIFQNLAYTFRFKIKEGVHLSLELPREPFILHTEKNRLIQVLSNFISNACKYTSEGSITAGYEVDEKEVYFFVTDTGKGIDKKDLPHVFERFAKFDAFVQGTGLGLSICELIIQNLGGKIGAESELGKGSTFWCTLPVTHPETE